jgi:hypothetical protein
LVEHDHSQLEEAEMLQAKPDAVLVFMCGLLGSRTVTLVPKVEQSLPQNEQ